MFNLVKISQKLKSVGNYLSSNRDLIKYNLLSVRKCKFVSGNPQSKVNRENREGDKLENFWEGELNKMKIKEDLSKEIEKKYQEEEFYVGRHLKDNNSSSTTLDPLVESNLVDVYYVPLTVNDVKLISNFTNNLSESLYKGGRVLLYNELKNYNRSQPIEKHLFFDPPYEPLSIDEISEIQKEFYELYKNEKIFNFILQQGKRIYDELKIIKEEKVNYYLQYISKLKYVDHYSQVINNVPFNTKITVDFKKFEDPSYVKFFLSNMKMDDNKLADHLKEIYFKFYYQIEETLKFRKKIDNNLDKEKSTPLDEIKNVIEPCLFDRINAYIDYLYFNNMNFEFKKSNNLEKEKEQYLIFEKLFFKGVCLNRYDNSEPNEYILIDSHEELGIRYYLHKYLTGESTKIYNEKNPLVLNSESVSNDYHNSLNFQIKERNRKIVLRVYMFLKHPYNLEIKRNEEKINISEYPISYSHNHLAIFENELEAPNHTYLINNNFERWLLKHKLNLNGWKLVDVDNFMKGNPFFLKKSSFQENFENILSNEENMINLLSKKFAEIKNTDKFILNTNIKDDKKTSSKKERKKKEEKETKIPSALQEDKITSLAFDYRVTKIKPPFNEMSYELDNEDRIKIDEELKILMDKQYKRKVDLTDKELQIESEFRQQLENESLDNHLKLENLIKIYSLGKKEKNNKQDSIQPVITVQIKDNNEKTEYKNELEKVVNNYIAKKIQRIMDKKELI